MNRKERNLLIRNSIIRYAARYSLLPTGRAIKSLAFRYKVPKQVVSGNISWLVTSGRLNMVRCKPESYLY